MKLTKVLPYIQLMRLHKPIGIFLLLWPTLWALWLASAGQPSPWLVLVFVLGVLLMRSAGCVINDIADRRIDCYVTRTRQRPLATGAVSKQSALYLFAALCSLALLLVLCLNTLTIQLSFVALALAIVYPFMKRVTYWPQLVLGFAFNWSIIMVYSAQTGHVSAQAWLLFTAGLVWTIAYDTLYAMVDRQDDIKIGLKSTAIILATADLFAIATLHVFCLLALLMLGIQMNLSLAYYLGLLVAAGSAVYQLITSRDRQSDSCFKAFLNNNYFGAAIFIGIVVAFW